MSEELTYKPLGILRADFEQKFGTPRQGALAKNVRARIELAAEWKGRGILTGLEGFSHVWLVSHLHLSVRTRQRGKIHPPRLDGAKIGVLASRSPHRPNNIGLTLARVVLCEGDRLELSEVDLVDGTPILDIKPYVAEADRPSEYRGGWTETVRPRFRECDFSEDADRDIESLVARGKITDPTRLRSLIREMLTHDPRP
ncbi:MAG TPA: tRNA (N6-threonylcarbamoyladenosine(37)-N6)-methyltransferase TrmO, partial [Bdellovibrionales bacterium]|nr:tRNA (N6-threonylcarbamoyladenosine(37)-N6)-methyltransferase TrmO [Bdellovibrionales bacterium]